MARRIHIVGRKNSGKTTLIVELVAHLTQLGYRIGTIKHTHHRHELDTPGKDSYRHGQAGAAVVGILAPEMNAVFWPTGSTDSKADRYALMTRFFEQCDFLLIEGDSQTDDPKVEVWRAETQTEPLASEDSSILAIVSDDSLDLPVIKRSRGDIAGLASWLVELANE